MQNTYARLQTRIKAAVIDSIVLLVLMYCTSELLNSLEDFNSSIRICLFILYFILYEPLLVSIFGNTLGHYYVDIKVKQEKNSNKNISFSIALVRFIIKFFLGWVSLLTITGSKKHQAIHDSIAKSVVIND